MLNRSKKLVTLIVGFILISSIVFSQDDQIPVRNDQAKRPALEETHHMDFGFGFGLDYGGLLGLQLGLTAGKHLTFFGAGGYYLFQGGWNVGVKALLIGKTSKHAFRPFLKGMYGCHSVIFVDGLDDYNKVYKGFTVGFGLEIRFGKKKKNGFDLDLNVPLRKPEFWSDYKAMKNDPRIGTVTGPSPVAFSVGFHHEF